MTREEAIWYLTPIAESASLERYKEALSMAVTALREQEERRWIPVAERLPNKSGCYVVIDKKYTSVLHYSSRYELFNAFDDLDQEFVERCAIMPTHWMPLPEPPKEEKDK